MKSIFRYDVEVVNNLLLCTDHYHILLKDEGGISKSCQPGQFVNLCIPHREDLVLRRPFSIAMTRPEESLFEIVYRVVGKGTKEMVNVKPGDVIDTLGPFGKRFHISEGIKNALLVGGGCGVAPLWGLAEHLYRGGCKMNVLLGFQSADKVFGEEIFRGFHADTLVTTDDGSYGLKGFVSEHIEKMLKKDVDWVYVCGPTPMFKAVLPLIKRAKVKGEVSLEERMGCGYGVCLSCVTGVAKGKAIVNQRVCTEGPVFNLEEVVLNDGT